MALIDQADSLFQALECWRTLWKRTVDATSVDRRELLGVANITPAIEHLSRRVIEISKTTESGNSPYLQRVPSYDMRDIHEFIRDFVVDNP